MQCKSPQAISFTLNPFWSKKGIFIGIDMVTRSLLLLFADDDSESDSEFSFPKSNDCRFTPTPRHPFTFVPQIYKSPSSDKQIVISSPHATRSMLMPASASTRRGVFVAMLSWPSLAPDEWFEPIWLAFHQFNKLNIYVSYYLNGLLHPALFIETLIN